MLAIESNYSNVYEMIFAPALDAFEKMFEYDEIRRNIIKMTIYQGTLTSLQFMEGDNKYDPIQALYTRRVRQLKDKNNNLRIKQKDLSQMTTTLQESFYSMGSAAKTLES